MKKNEITLFIKENGLLLIILLGFIIRLIFFLSLQPWNSKLLDKTLNMSDEIEYHRVALDLVKNKSFENFSSFRTPIYPMFIAVIYGFTNLNIAVVFMVQIILNLFSVFFAYKIANQLFNEKIALLTALLFSIDPLNIIYSIQLLTDVLFVFLFLVSIYCLCRYFDSGKISTIAWSALFLGLATLTRPISFLFPFIVIFFLFINRQPNLKFKLIHSIIYSLVYMATISPWLMHNYSQYGKAQLSSISGYNLLIFNVSSTEASKTKKPIEEVQHYFNNMAIQRGSDSTALNPSNKEPFKNSAIYTDIAKEYIKDNFLLYIKRNLIGIAYMFIATPTGLIVTNFNLESKYHSEHYAGKKFSGGFKYLNFLKKMSTIELYITLSMFVFLFINYIFSFYEILRSTGNKKARNYILLFIITILYFSVLTGVVGASRYRLPIMPFIYILSAAGIISFFEKSIKPVFNSKKSSQNAIIK